MIFQTQCRQCGNRECNYWSQHGDHEYELSHSPVHDLLWQDNIQPTHIQVDAALGSLRELNQDLQAIDEDISQMRIHLQDLIAKRRAWHIYAETHKGFVSALRRIPSEILSQIFILALPDFPFALTRNAAPLIFDRVCRRWKDVSRRTSALWSYITLELRNDRKSLDLSAASVCLSRAGNQPLSIALGAGPWAKLSPMLMDPGHPAIALLAAHCERWHAVSLQVEASVLNRDLAVVQGRLSSLRNLTVHISNVDLPDEDDFRNMYDEETDDESTGDQGATNEYATRCVEIFAVAPALKYFESGCGYADVHIGQKILSVPWQSLTSLCLYEVKAVDIWDILKDSPNLLEFKGEFYPYGNNPCRASLVPNIRLEHLRSMYLALPESSDMLSTLTLPAVEHLFFRLYPDELNEPSEPWSVRSGLNTLVSQSECTVSSLRLMAPDRCTQPEEIIRSCLAVLPALSELELCRDLGPVFPRIIIADANTHLLPNLATLRLIAHDDKCPWDMLAVFLKARRVGRGPHTLLQRLELDTDADYYEPGNGWQGFVAALDDLESQGMEVVMWTTLQGCSSEDQHWYEE